MASGFLAESTGTCVDGFGDAAGSGWLLREYMVHPVILDAIYLWLTFDSESFKHLCLSLLLSNISLSNGFMWICSQSGGRKPFHTIPDFPRAHVNDEPSCVPAGGLFVCCQRGNRALHLKGKRKEGIQ